MRASWQEDGAWHTRLRGRQVFADARINKGTGFPAREREALGLVGLMPPRVLTLDQQATRAYSQYCTEPTDLAKNVYLTALHDRNEVLYYRLVTDHLPEMLPIVYTPTIGDAIERYSHMYRRPRGVYLSVDAAELVEPSLAATGLNPDEVTILVGTSTRPGAFTETVVRTMAERCRRPIILPLSNPTRLAEAKPADLLRWTEGRALVATGSPFDPVTYERVTYAIGQANNALVFPGIGLGVTVARAARVTEGMLFAAARAVAGRVDATTAGASLLPQINDVRETSVAVAVAVARAAAADGLARAALEDDLEAQVRRSMWDPVYRPVRPA